LVFTLARLVSISAPLLAWKTNPEGLVSAAKEWTTFTPLRRRVDLAGTLNV